MGGVGNMCGSLVGSWDKDIFTSLVAWSAGLNAITIKKLREGFGCSIAPEGGG